MNKIKLYRYLLFIFGDKKYTKDWLIRKNNALSGRSPINVSPKRVMFMLELSGHIIP